MGGELALLMMIDSVTLVFCSDKMHFSPRYKTFSTQLEYVLCKMLLFVDLTPDLSSLGELIVPALAGI